MPRSGRNALHPLSLATGRLIISAVDAKGRAALLFRTKLEVGSNLFFEQHNTTAVVSLSRAWSEFWNDAAPLKVGAKVSTEKHALVRSDCMRRGESQQS